MYERGKIEDSFYILKESGTSYKNAYKVDIVSLSEDEDLNNTCKYFVIVSIDGMSAREDADNLSEAHAFADKAVEQLERELILRQNRFDS
ncbi:hypothetical protein CD149_10240 [Staphylococcus condimenti]|uniref:Uncharacterized protein n=1 Tax=Staphylococcus condimenti TaxID=70255 RepID=A0AB37H0H5_9STAP|nr:hypothetical protein [Staphylococcus condimenti]AMY05239.1 hypothetical protein A4G25_04520 [Staphylococcus condimenti]PNZ58431.1 hypothetical protein CD149_10240 [Staphylococcus condimenti]QQS82956.1 hypothetical protein I6J05_01160 [Staphylococcus condimenti]QRP94609.1 hypothetical protein I6J35_07865 [Staphylococcus condimenti]VEG64832.1 Uncharacterised protein [Staphylococcus condimenti]